MLFKIFSYIQENTRSESTVCQLNSTQGDTEGVETPGRGREREGAVFGEGWFGFCFFLRTRHTCFSQWRAVSSQLAGAHEEDLIICHIIHESSTRARELRSCREGRTESVSTGCWWAKRGRVTPETTDNRALWCEKAGDKWIWSVFWWVFIRLISWSSCVCSTEGLRRSSPVFTCCKTAFMDFFYTLWGFKINQINLKWWFMMFFLRLVSHLLTLHSCVKCH